MGNEADCGVRFGKQRARGKALLETSELIFRSADGAFRFQIAFSSIQSAKVARGELRLQTSDGLAVFELGAAAEKWCKKILHPKTRMEKLGIKPDAVVSLVGDFDAQFRAELQRCTKTVTTGRVTANSAWIFFAVRSSHELPRISKLAKSVKGAAALWVVYPKGQKPLSENAVLGAGRKAGLRDVKVVGFSLTHTALKFVLPLERR